MKYATCRTAPTSSIDQAVELIRQAKHNPVSQSQMDSGGLELF